MADPQTPEKGDGMTETLESLCYQLRKLADDAMMQIDADRLSRAADTITALQAERDAALARAEAAEAREPYIVKISPYHGICIGGRWDNWMFHMSANGQWVSQQKLSTAALTPPADLAARVSGTPDRGKMIRPAPDQAMCGGYPTAKGEQP